ncbi:hypothetical protein Bca4012_033410 [Brassica carinata]
MTRGKTDGNHIEAQTTSIQPKPKQDSTVLLRVETTVTPRTHVGASHRLHRLGQPAGTRRTFTGTDASEPRSMKPHRFQPNSIIFLA